MIDTYTLADFKVGDRVKAFHPQTMGVMHWATVEKVGRKALTVRWHVTGRTGFLRTRDVSEIGEFAREETYVTKTGRVMTEDEIDEYVAEAEAGYDVSKLKDA